MLVLGRKKAETIHINGPCVVTLVEVMGGKVRLGIEATEDVEILRGELVAKGASKPRSPTISRKEAFSAGMGEQWAALRRLVDQGA